MVRGKRESKRFAPSRWAERLVPLILIVLLLALAVTILVVLLSLFGLTPA